MNPRIKTLSEHFPVTAGKSFRKVLSVGENLAVKSSRSQSFTHASLETLRIPNFVENNP